MGSTESNPAILAARRAFFTMRGVPINTLRPSTLKFLGMISKLVSISLTRA